MKKVLLLFVIIVLPIVIIKANDTGINKSNETKASKDEANSSFSYDDTLKLLTIRFFESEMEKDFPEVIERMKCSDDYSFDEEFTLPEELWKAVGAKKPLVVKKGKYPMKYKDGVYSIYIQY